MSDTENQTEVLTPHPPIMANTKPLMPFRSYIAAPPTFAPDNLKSWFTMLELNMKARGLLLDQEKVQDALGLLPLNYVDEVIHLINQDAPTVNNYELLRSKVMELSRPNKQRRIRALFKDKTLGDMRPSQFLRQQRGLVDDVDFHDDIFKDRFLAALPETLRISLAPQAASHTVDALAGMADAIIQYTQVSDEKVVNAVHETSYPRSSQGHKSFSPAPHSRAVFDSAGAPRGGERGDFRPRDRSLSQARTTSSQPDTNMSGVMQQISQQSTEIAVLKTQISNLAVNFDRLMTSFEIIQRQLSTLVLPPPLPQEQQRAWRPRDRSRGGQKFRARSPAPTGAQDRTLCYYHATYGINANKCSQPCEWATSPQSENH